MNRREQDHRHRELRLAPKRRPCRRNKDQHTTVMGIAYQELVADMSHAFPASSRGDCGLMRPSAGGYGELSDAEPLGLQAWFNFPKSRLRAWACRTRTQESVGELSV